MDLLEFMIQGRLHGNGERSDVQMRRDEFPIVHMAIKDAVVRALKDVRAEIEAKKVKEVICIEEDLINGAFDDALDIIDRKIAEVEKNENS